MACAPRASLKTGAIVSGYSFPSLTTIDRFPLSTSVLRRIAAQNLHPIETDGTRPLRHA
jgi:hypothetical protein